MNECIGSYDEFEMNNENDTLEQFLKMAPPAPEKNEVWTQPIETNTTSTTPLNLLKVNGNRNSFDT